MQWTKVAFIRHAFFIFWGIFLWRIENINKLKIETLNLIIIIGTHCYQPYMYVLGPTLQISVFEKRRVLGLTPHSVTHGWKLVSHFCYPFFFPSLHPLSLPLHTRMNHQWMGASFCKTYIMAKQCQICIPTFVLWTMVLNWDSSPHSTHNLCCVTHFYDYFAEFAEYEIGV